LLAFFQIAIEISIYLSIICSLFKKKVLYVVGLYLDCFP